MHIDIFRTPETKDLLIEDAWFSLQPEDPEHPSYVASTFIQVEVLKFCDCGNEDIALDYIKRCLEFIDNENEAIGSEERKNDFKEWYKKQRKEAESVFGGLGAEYLFLYWADKEGFTEHGGSVTSSWLTKEGRLLMEDLQKLYPEDASDETR